jgi:DNA-binding CsgD family transcriptional regulator
MAVGVLVDVAAGDIERGRDRADHALDQAQAADYVRALAPAHEARGLVTRADGEPYAAEDAFHDMLAASVRAGHLPGACDALDGLVGAVGDGERFAEAARLRGAADRLRQAHGYAPFPVRRSRRERDLQRVRDALDPDVFGARWAEGWALPGDEAVAYAQRGRGERKRPPFGWDSLTPAEENVVALVAEGLTNPQIGERLFVSPRTVQSHLRQARRVDPGRARHQGDRAPLPPSPSMAVTRC